MDASHKWKFFRAGGFDQVRLDSGTDLMALDDLDQKLWLALACPTQGLEFDGKTLALIDTDKDARIRVPEIIAASRWACACLKNPNDLLDGSPSLPLTAINDATDEGRQLLASAKQILANLGKSDATTISAEDTGDTARIFAQTKFNGDGIVPADATDDANLQAVINDIVACFGAEADRSGKPGVNQAKADQFFADIQAHSDWWKKGEGDATILPLGASTAAAVAAIRAVKSKVEDYFARCRLAAFDARAIEALNREEKEYLAVAAKDMTVTSAEIAGFPLSRIEAGRSLPLKEGLNPAWAAAIARLQADAISKALPGERSALTEAEWTALLGKFAAYDAWESGKGGATVEKLGVPRVREILAGKSRDAINALIVKDKALEPEANAIAAVDKLVRYHRDLFKLLNNFVTFSDFYGRRDKAIFQAGTLFLDQRSCDLCLPVEDPAKHAAMAGLAGTYLAYCDCVRKATGEKRLIVAAFTDGDSDNLMIGRNGIFYDRQGRDWDATITKIIDNPISIRQAFWAPYKKLVRFIEEQVAKRAAAADAAGTASMQSAATTAANADKSKPAEPKKVDVGTVAALGVAFGAIGTALSALAAGLFKLEPWQVPLAFIVIALVISGPSMIIAFMKLRKRNLGPILDANGWAVNARAKINVPFGRSLTQVAKLPVGASIDISDKFAPRSSFLPKFLFIVFLIWWIWAFLNDSQGRLYRWTDGKYGKPSAEIQKRLDDEEAARKKAAAEKDAVDKGLAVAKASSENSPTAAATATVTITNVGTNAVQPPK